FTGLQLGPEGQTPPDDPSPYRGAAFPQNVLSIALAPLAEDPEWAGLLPIAALERAVRDRSPGARERAAHAEAARTQARAWRTAFHALAGARRPALARLATEQRRFELANAHWLARYEVFEALVEAYASADVRRWDGPAGSGLDGRLWHADGDANQARA